MILVLLLCIALAVLHAWRRRAPWHDPAVLHALVWGVTALTFVAFGERVNQPSIATLSILCAGIAGFSLAVAAGQSLVRPLAASASPDDMRVATLAVIVAGAALLALLYRGMDLVPAGHEGSWFHALRRAVTEGRQSFGAAAYLANAAFAAVFVALLAARRRLAWIFGGVAAALALVAAVLLTGRTFLILYLVLCAVALGYNLRPRPAAILGGLVVVLVVGVVVTLVQQRAATWQSSALGGIEYEILHYVPSATAAFDHLVRSDPALAWGANSLRTVFAVLRTAGLQVPVADLVRPYVNVPMAVNVYTVFSPYYLDFGAVGAIAALSLLGALTGAVSRFAANAQPVAVMAQAILLYAALMQFFQDQYASLLSQWVQLVVLAWLFSVAGRPRRGA